MPMLKTILLILLVVLLAGCSAVAGIFKAGWWVGVIFAVIVVGALVLLFRKR